MITLKATTCGVVKLSRCPSYKIRHKDCIDEPYDDSDKVLCGQTVIGTGAKVTQHAITGMGVVTVDKQFGRPWIEIDVHVNGVLVASSDGPSGDYGAWNFYYTQGDCSVTITPDPDFPEAQWAYTLACPI